MKMPMQQPLLATLAIALALAVTPLPARDASPAQHGVIGVDDTMLSAEFWIARLAHPDEVVLDRAAIAAENANLLRMDRTMHDLHALPKVLPRKLVADWIDALSERPTRPLYDVAGKQVPPQTLDALVANLDLGAIPEQHATRYGLVAERADLRTFPTHQRVFDERGDTDIDRFQESALFPGTPVAIAHASRDGRWWFVVSPRYAAWIDKNRVAEGPADQVLGYAERAPYRIVTAATVDTVFTPEQPALSRLRLDMSTRVPLAADWPADKPVNGEYPYTSHVIELPLRGADGALKLAPALLQKNADTQADYLPLTRANLLRQAFKFLGERYGWGHSYDARDCSGFVSDVYRSMGVLMPRNTRDQSVSPGLDHHLFTAADDRAARMAAAHALEVGDLVYIPGHVMMVIGTQDNEPYVIHDTSGIAYRRPDGSMARVHLNAVSVSPLLPLQFNESQLYVDRMTSIVRIRPDTAKEAPRAP